MSIVLAEVLIIGGGLGMAFYFANRAFEGSTARHVEEQTSKQSGRALIGDACSQASDCSTLLTLPGAGASATSDVCCSNNVCRLKRPGALNIKYCPSDVLARALPQPQEERNAIQERIRDNPKLTELITSTTAAFSTKGINEGCTFDADCADSGKAGEGPAPFVGNKVGCCHGTCKRLKKDWVGVGNCPEVCVGALFGRPGSCSQDY